MIRNISRSADETALAEKPPPWRSFHACSLVRRFSVPAERWKERARTGLTDFQIQAALRYELGIMGGSGGPGQPSLAYQGSGLKIWASWDGINMV